MKNFLFTHIFTTKQIISKYAAFKGALYRNCKCAGTFAFKGKGPPTATAISR